MNKAGDLPLTAQTLGCHFIGNQWVRPADGRTVPVVDPGTGEIFAGSGHGREKGLAGLLGFTTLKTVAIKHN